MLEVGTRVDKRERRSSVSGPHESNGKNGIYIIQFHFLVNSCGFLYLAENRNQLFLLLRKKNYLNIVTKMVMI